MKIKLRKSQILACVCALQLSACAMIEKDTQQPLELLSPSVMAMIQQDAMNKTRNTADVDGEEPVNPNAISIEALLMNALNQGGAAVTDANRNEKEQVAPSQSDHVSIPKPQKKPSVKAG